MTFFKNRLYYIYNYFLCVIYAQKIVISNMLYSKTKEVFMILSVRVDNFLIYSHEVELSLIADMRIKKFKSNVFDINNFNVLKSVCVYGPNNSGKTCIIRAINSIAKVLLSIVAEVPPNIFTNSNICSFGISFAENGKVYSYDFKYDSTIVNNYKKGFIYECLKELSLDKYGNQQEKEIFIRDTVNDKYRFYNDENLSKILSSVSSDNILIYTINSAKYPKLEEYKSILRNFASKITIVNSNNIPIEKTINVLKNNEEIRKKTVELIKLADLDIDDYNYYKPKNNVEDSAIFNNNSPELQEDVFKSTNLLNDMYRLASVHRGKVVQSIHFDSTGTKKMVAIASYIIEALTYGKILVVDELDSSLHFKLTRAIVSLFNNEINSKAQLIFTAHDVTLLDCKTLFRKDQIWFASKDRESEYLYSLADFNSADDKVRSDSDLFEKYNSGVFGALPEPDLISVLIPALATKGEEK